MNIELLKKLVKLANNNPNDHEANSAARRACKLIEKSKFNFNDDIKSSTKFYEESQSAQDMWDMLNNMRERAESETRYQKEQQQTKASKRDTHNPFDIPYNPVDKPYYARKRERGFGNTVQPLRCNTCKKIINSKFNGNPELFECVSCKWQRF